MAARRLLLVVADDWCHDSVNTVPYIARLVDGAPERLEIRVVGSKAGRAIMEAHPTPDGRAATPTVVVLDADGRFLASWTERPSGIQSQVIEQKKTQMQSVVHDHLMKWYEKDAGKTTMAEIAALVEK